LRYTDFKRIGFWVGIPTLYGCSAKYGHVQQVGLIGVHMACPFSGKFSWHQIFFYCIGMYAVVFLGQGALQVPFKFQPGTIKNGRPLLWPPALKVVTCYS
jgi:hypothetical protein